MSAPILVVVIVPDAELRSALAAQVAASGVTLLTAAEPRAARNIKRPAILVIDEAAMSGAAGEWVETLWHEGRWVKVTVLTVGIPIPDDGRGWLNYADRDSAAQALTQLIDEWTETGNR